MDERAAEGEFDLVVPLDYKIIELLPDDGTTLGGLYPIGETGRELARKFGLQSSKMTTRIRALNRFGLIVAKRGLGSSPIYQRTPRGKEILELWLREQQSQKSEPTS